MTEIDWLIVGLLVLSSGVGITRGVVREILAIVGWVAGIMLALAFSGDFADMIPLESLGYLPRVLIASILLIVAALFCVGLLGLLIRKLLEVAELTFEDRALGAVFGFLRGAVVVCAGVFFFGLIDDVKTSKVWQQSSLIAPAETVIDWSLPYLPDWFASLRNGSSSPLSAAGIPLASGRGSQRIMRKGVRQARPFLISFHKAIGP